MRGVIFKTKTNCGKLLSSENKNVWLFVVQSVVFSLPDLKSLNSYLDTPSYIVFKAYCCIVKTLD